MKKALFSAILATGAAFGAFSLGAEEAVSRPNHELSRRVVGQVLNNNDFAVDIYKRIAKGHKGNLFISPYSITTALAMTYAGVSESGEAAFGKAIRLGPNSEVHQDLGTLNRLVEGARGVKLNTANSIWCAKGRKFHDRFEKLISKNYGSKKSAALIGELDFVDDAEGSRKFLNKWVEKRTNDKIKDLIPEGEIDSSTVSVLVNAIYFKGDWKTAFNKKRTHKADFGIGKTKIKCDMMSLPGETEVLVSQNWETGAAAASLPYKGEDVAMVLMLPPRKTSLAEFEKNLTRQFIEKTVADLHVQEVTAFNMPKFKIEGETLSILSTLQEMGMPASGFNRMLEGSDPFISGVFHKGFCQVDETGTEAAAATAVAMKESAGAYLVFDRPFLFLIRHEKTGQILFMGRMEDPSK